MAEVTSGAEVLEHDQEARGLVETHSVDSTLRDSDFVGFRWEPRICFSNKFPADVDAAGLGPTF